MPRPQLLAQALFIEALNVDEMRLPRIIRDLFQRDDMDVAQLDTSRSNPVRLVTRFYAKTLRLLDKRLFCKTRGVQWGEPRTSMNFPNWLAISFTNSTREIPLCPSRESAISI